MNYASSSPPACWYPDPAGSGGERFWDGTAWSQATRDAQPPAPPQPELQEARPDPSPYAVPQQQPTQPAPPQYQQYQQHPLQPGQPYPVQPGQRLVPGQGGRPLAGFGKRLGAWLLDYVLTLVVVTGTTFNLSATVTSGLESYFENLFWALQTQSPAPPVPGSLLADYFLLLAVIAAIHIAYRILANGLLGSTLGERVLKLEVAREGDETLARIGWPAAIVRGLLSGGFIAMGIFLGFIDLIFAAFGKRRQALHDLASKSVVYENR